MKTNPCAKINIGLYVTEKRVDGYHNLETVFYPIPLCDELIVEKAETDCLDIQGIPVAGSMQDNLVMKVVYLLREKGYNVPSVRIQLTKKIPSGAGLGGGSSDAAFMMKMLNEMFHLCLTNEQMEELVATLGADCAFFIQCRPVLAEGIGNLFSPVDVDLTGKYLVLVKPDDFISTKEAYGNVTPAHPEISLKNKIEASRELWKNSIKNDFEESVFPMHPTVRRIKEDLYRHGAFYAAMSGSGSSVYGLFDKPVEVDEEYFTFKTRL